MIRTEGDRDTLLAIDRTLVAHETHWAVREIILLMKRTLKRLDLTARSFFALIEPGSAFAGSLFELALAADRSYMLDDPAQESFIALSPMNGGRLPMSNGLSRLQGRFLAEPEKAASLVADQGRFDPREAAEAGLVTVAPDEIDWDDEVRLAVEARAAFSPVTAAPDDIDWADEIRIAIEERASMSPDALTGLEANLRFAGKENMTTRIFGRLTAWQNWIFQRPNAVGEKGALRVYGQQGRPEFDWKRT